MTTTETSLEDHQLADTLDSLPNQEVVEVLPGVTVRRFGYSYPRYDVEMPNGDRFTERFSLRTARRINAALIVTGLLRIETDPTSGAASAHLRELLAERGLAHLLRTEMEAGDE